MPENRLLQPDDRARIYLRPLSPLPVADAPADALPLAGGRFAFALAELIVRRDGVIDRAVASVPEIRAWGRQNGPTVSARIDHLLDALSRPRPPLAGLDVDRPRLMAVLNVTPDSFSDGGEFLDPARAIARGLALHAAGADFIDVGGESTRPGAAPVSPETERARIEPVVAALAAAGARVSIDTRHALVMRAALSAGAVLINDISGLTGDPDSLAVAAASGAPVALMHMRGEPGTMQEAPDYADAALDVYDWLEARLEACRAAGIPLERILVDPGIGFGKTVGHNLDILRQFSLYHGLGATLLAGVSRKRFIAALSGGEPPRERLPGTITASLMALNQGCQSLRVHDLAEFAQVRAVWEGLHPAPPTRK